MKTICQCCRRRNGNECSEDGIHCDDYGRHYQGANCIHREKLHDLFLPLQTMGEVVDVVRDLEIKVRQLEEKNVSLEKTNSRLYNTIRKLSEADDPTAISQEQIDKHLRG